MADGWKAEPGYALASESVVRHFDWSRSDFTWGVRGRAGCGVRYIPPLYGNSHPSEKGAAPILAVAAPFGPGLVYRFYGVCKGDRCGD